MASFKGEIDSPPFKRTVHQRLVLDLSTQVQGTNPAGRSQFTDDDAIRPYPHRQALDRVDSQLDLLVYEVFLLPRRVVNVTRFRCNFLTLNGC
jgi:hypothetical protein